MPGLQVTMQIPTPFEYTEIKDFGDVATFQDAVLNHLDNLNRYLQSGRESLLDFLEDGDINTLSVGKLTAGTLAVDKVFIGSAQFELDGLLTQIRIKDDQGTPITRVEIGKFGSGSAYGIKIRNAGGSTIFETSSTDSLDGGILNTGTVLGAAIKTNDITATQIAASTITATEMNVSTLSAITANLGTITAGTITGALIRTATGNPRIELTTTTLTGRNSGGTVIFDLQTGGTVRFGDSGADNILFSSGVLSVTGDIIASGNIQANAVITTKINNSAVTNAKINDVAFNKITAGTISTTGIIKLDSGADIQMRRSASDSNLIEFQDTGGTTKATLKLFATDQFSILGVGSQRVELQPDGDIIIRPDSRAVDQVQLEGIVHILDEFRLNTATSDPANVVGNMYFNTTSNKIKVYTGSWETVTSS